MTPELRIREFALTCGFHAVGIAPAAIDSRDQSRFQEFIRNNEYGDMEWMARSPEVRMAPKALWPDVKSVIVTGMNYYPFPTFPPPKLAPDVGRISLYALNRDYHKVVKKRLKQLARWMVGRFHCQVKIFVDTAPVLEKALAAQSGIGWMGKQTHIVSRSFGPWLFLGVVYTDLLLKPDPPEKNRCGSCSRCLQACPTGALTAPYRLDPRRCIAYLTIEHKGAIDPVFHHAMGNRIYGCDECLWACPWNRFIKLTTEPAFHPRPELVTPCLTDLISLDDDRFRNLFSGSPIKRIGVDRFVRNVTIAWQNRHL